MYEPSRAMGDGFCLMASSHLLEGQVFDGGTRQYYAIVRFVLDLAESLIVGIHCEDRGGLRDKEFACVSETGCMVKLQVRYKVSRGKRTHNVQGSNSCPRSCLGR